MEEDNLKTQKECDRHLPEANIARIIKKHLPKDLKLAKEAKTTFQECVSEFICFITCEACDKCNKEQRKTINGDDILYSMNILGFDHYVPILKEYLDKYRESQKLVSAESNENNSNDLTEKEEDEKC